MLQIERIGIKYALMEEVLNHKGPPVISEVFLTVTPVGIVAEIESTKRRIQAEIDDVTEQTNLGIDTIIMNAIANTNKDNCVSTTGDTTITQRSLDAEIVRLTHMSHLMTTLYHGIESASLNLHHEFNVTQNSTFINEIPTIANGSPSVESESPTTTNESPTIANEGLTISHTRPTVTKDTSSITKQYVSEMILMIHDNSNLEDDERIMSEMEDERTEDLRIELHQLGLDEQRTHDMELSLLRDDIIHYENALTDQIIADFERIDSSSDENDVFHRDWWNEAPESSDESSNNYTDSACVTQDNSSPLNDSAFFEQVERAYNLDTDTDSDDRNENDANVAELLQANMKLLTFLTQQHETIARLRTRIVRLKTLIYDLSFRPVGPLPNNGTSIPNASSPPNVSSIPSPTPPSVEVYYGIQRGRTNWRV
jgi:hypothetical protein